jgi:hypothetical protein
MASSISPPKALEAAKKLVGQWPHLKADQPDVFIAAVGAVLSEYPFGVVEECVDPRTGPVNKIKFLSIVELRQWLEERVVYHRALASWRPRPEPQNAPPRVYAPEYCAAMVTRFRALLQGMRRAADPVVSLMRAHRRAAQERLAADRARALAELGEPPNPAPIDTGHHARVAADLSARKAAREGDPPEVA